MRVLIVDDEPLSRRALTDAVGARNDLEALDSAADALEAFELLKGRTYDVLLLDIHMPELSGIELADRLNKRQGPIPSIVFVTAHHQHAIEAFEKHAVDYVLKPFSKARLHEALDVAFRRTESERAAQLVRILPQVETLLSKSTKVAIKTNGRILFIDPADVAVVEAQGNYVLLQRQSGTYLLRESISTIAVKLKPYGFIRIHRSVLVNSSFVEEIQPWSTGEIRATPERRQGVYGVAHLQEQFEVHSSHLGRNRKLCRGVAAEQMVRELVLKLANYSWKCPYGFPPLFLSNDLAQISDIAIEGSAARLVRRTCAHGFFPTNPFRFQDSWTAPESRCARQYCRLSRRRYPSAA